MYDTEDVLEAARSIRPFLAELLRTGFAATDVELASYLARARLGEKVDNLILEFLSRDEKTRAWTRAFLDSKYPPDMRSYVAPPGGGCPVPIGKYRCPENDYVWYRRNEEIAVPQCPTHGLALERVE